VAEAPLLRHRDPLHQRRVILEPQVVEQGRVRWDYGPEGGVLEEVSETVEEEAAEAETASA